MWIDEEKRDIQQSFQQDTIGRKYSAKFVSTPKTSFKSPKKAEIVSLNINTPIDKEKFSKLSQETKKMYIEHLRDEYGARSGWVAKMLGYDRAYFSVMCGKLGVSFLGVRKYTEKDAALMWAKFMSQSDQERPAEKPVEVEPVKQEEPKQETDLRPYALATALRDGTMCNKISMEFHGNVNPVYLASIVNCVCGEAGSCKITFTIEKDG